MQTPGGASLDTTRPSLDAESLAGPPEPHDAGLRAVLEIYEDLQIDAEWTVWDRRGFTWWAHDHAQLVWSEEGVDSFGEVVYRVHVETEWGGGTAISGRERQAAVAVLMGSMSLAGAVVSGNELRWRSHVVVHEENRQWLTKPLELAALVQATNVRRTDILDTWSCSRRRASTPRAERGARPTRCSTRSLTCRPMTFDLSFGERASIGAGVRMTLRWPSFPETLGVQEFPLDLNRMEVHAEPLAHLLGSWAADLPDGSEPTPFFTCFVPNVTLRRGVLLNLVLSMGVRARWIESRFA